MSGKQPPGVQIQHCHPFPGANPACPERVRERITVSSKLFVTDLSAVAVDHSDLGRECLPCSVQEADRAQRNMVCFVNHRKAPSSDLSNLYESACGREIIHFEG